MDKKNDCTANDSLTLREIQLAELDILVKFDEYCKQNSLRYSLCGGTLLGAVRHKGFIPWDDDIDVMMPRPDYEKLRCYSKQRSIAPNIIFRCGEDGNIRAPFGKLLNIETSVKIKYINDANAEHLWIDIYPVDGLPDSLTEIEKIYKTANYLMKILKLSQARLGEGRTSIRKVLKYIFKPICRMIKSIHIVHLLDQLTNPFDFEKSFYIGVVTGEEFGFNECMEREQFIKFTPLEFEGRLFPVMGCWDKYLSNCYGDYLSPPPISKRENHIINIRNS